MAKRILRLCREGEFLFLLAVFASFLVFLRESAAYPSDTRAFPELVILAVLLLSGVLLFLYLFAPSWRDAAAAPGEETQDPSSASWPTRGRFLRGWVSIGVALLAALLFGFLFLIPASFVSYVLLLGQREMRGKVAVLSLATMVVVYFVFDRFLGIPTMHGVLRTG